MISHTITDEWGDNTYSVLAVDFATRRMVVECGDAVTSVRVGFELRQLTLLDGRKVDDWHRFDPGQTWVTPAPCAAAQGGRPLGRCLDYDRFLIRPVGPGLRPLRDWLMAAAKAERADQARKAALAAEIRPVGPTRGYSQEQVERLAELRTDPQLPVSVEVLARGSRLAPVAEWLLDARRRLVHGDDLRLLFERHRVGYAGPADIDGVVSPLLGLRLVELYDYAPQPGTRVGETDGQLSKAEQAAWRKHGKRPAYMRDGIVVGSPFWYFKAGPRLAELPEFSV